MSRRGGKDFAREVCILPRTKKVCPNNGIFLEGIRTNEYTETANFTKQMHDMHIDAQIAAESVYHEYERFEEFHSDRAASQQCYGFQTRCFLPRLAMGGSVLCRPMEVEEEIGEKPPDKPSLGSASIIQTTLPSQPDTSSRLWSDGVRASTGISAILGAWGPLRTAAAPPAVSCGDRAEPSGVSSIVPVADQGFKPDQGSLPPAGPKPEDPHNLPVGAVRETGNESAEHVLVAAHNSSPHRRPALPDVATTTTGAPPCVPDWATAAQPPENSAQASSAVQAVPPPTPNAAGTAQLAHSTSDRRPTPDPHSTDGRVLPDPSASTASNSGRSSRDDASEDERLLAGPGSGPPGSLKGAERPPERSSGPEVVELVAVEDALEQREAPRGEGGAGAGAAAAGSSREEAEEPAELLCAVCYSAFEEHMWVSSSLSNPEGPACLRSELEGTESLSGFPEPSVFCLRKVLEGQKVLSVRSTGICTKTKAFLRKKVLMEKGFSPCTGESADQPFYGARYC
jgi:hypothetical protein